MTANATPRPWVAADETGSEQIIICQSRYGGGGFIGVVTEIDYSMDGVQGAMEARANAAVAAMEKA